MVHVDKDSLEAGRFLAHPPPGEEVVISGNSGAFPDSDSVTEFAEKLFRKVDLISGDGRRWTLDHPEIPQRTGKLNNISKFDAGYFGIHYKQAHAMDPMCRMVLEKAAEAVFDAGVNPQSLYGARVGVFVGACFSETEKTWFYEKLQVNGFGITGCARTMLANRISYWLGVKGPSYTVDTACSSSLYAFEHGYRAIREGLCDSAIVAGTNLCLHPFVSLQFSRLGVLSKDGKCKSFDDSANGYCRSEAISVMFLQKKKDARRIYATVVHAKTNCDGYKEEGITFPSGPLQQSLLEEFYEECQIDPSELAWVEAHGTGTKVGDPEEVKAIENVFCAKRKTPLKMGSLKSNIGHSEPASGLLSITKAVIAMEYGFIPPNINYKTPRKEIDALHNGKIEVVTEKEPWDGGLVGVNSFGFGGANCHVLLKWNEKNKINKGLPNDSLPRLVCVSGRTHEAIDSMLSSLENHRDVELIRLYHSIFKEEVPGHLYRGYTIVTKTGKVARGIKACPTLRQPIWSYYPGMGVEWKNGLGNLMKLPIFMQPFNDCLDTLKKQNFDLMAFFHGKTDDKSITFRNILTNSIVQLVFANVLKNVGFEPDKIVGTSFGEITCAYVDGALSFEQAVLTAFFVAKAASQLESQKGSTVLIGLSYSEVKPICSSDISFVYQGENYSIIAGSDKSVKSVMDKAKTMGVSSGVLMGIPLHSSQVSSIKSTLQQQLQKVITQNRVSSPKWISTSIKDKKNAINFTVSAEYFCNNLINPVCMEAWLSTVERGSTIIEMSPNHTFNMFLNKKAQREELSYIQILPENVSDLMVTFFTALGEIANSGASLDLSLFYPTVEYPVSRSTPMISPVIRWDHSDDWFVCSYKTQDRITTGERFVAITLKDEEQEYISGHVVDGRNLFPATGYLFLVWETIALMNAKLYGEVPVVFENVRFNRATNMPKDGGTVDFTITIQRSSGFFEVMESGAAIVTGKVFVPEDVSRELSGLAHSDNLTPDDDMFVVKSKDIYKELRLRGYNYKGLFRGVTCSNLEGNRGYIKWNNNWVAFMDNMLQMQIMNSDSRGLFVPTGLSRVVIDAVKHNKIVQQLDEENREIPVYNHKFVRLIRAGGIEIRGLNASAISRKKPLGEAVLENYSFLPYHPTNEGLDLDAIVRLFVHITLENVPTISVKVYEMGELDTQETYLCHSIIKALADLPLIQPDVIVFQAQSGKMGEEGHAPEISTEDKKLPTDQTALIVIGCNLMNPANEQALQACLNGVKENGFIISRDKVHYDVTSNNVIKCSSIVLGDTYYTLLRKAKGGSKKTTAIEVSNESFGWIKTLQETLKSDEFKRVVIYAQNQPMSGVVGLVNCILKEGYVEKARCFFISDPKAPAFSLNEPFYMKQIEKELAINVYKDGAWGSYRHFKLEPKSDIDSAHAYVSFYTRGDLSSLTWTEGHLSKPIARGENCDVIHVCYSALNFRDVMTSTGKIAPEVVEKNRLVQDCVQGLEFSGVDNSGKRVMGIVGQKGIATIVDKKDSVFWDVPDDWTLEEAATVPCVYGTIVYAFHLVGLPQKGDSILIHAGTGGVGQAAIHFALFHGCKVFTTVGTPEKREFIKKTFQLTDNQIGNSRDTSFEQLIMRETNGRGVDFVMNSLAEEKLLASVRCLAKGGRFMELGKFDMANDNPLGVEFLKREASIHGIMLNICFDMESKWKTLLLNLVSEAVKKGAIKPFSRTVFKREDTEAALRHMAAGKHMGKVLIKIKEEEDLIPKPKLQIVKARSRFYCEENKTYVVLGGLGGFGLELTDWLILRKAKKVVLSSRSGVKEGYQAMRIKTWESYGVKVLVCTDDVSTEEGALSLLKKSNELGPVGGIFNLAVVLRDAIFDNQNDEEFVTSFKPKAIATQWLDKLSRKMCPELDYFVVFSSVSCGRGNAGQTNYGMSNSIMERICEKRVEDGYPGLAIQWGAVGDVGLVANMQEENSEIVIGGTLPQKIESCLSVMDVFLNDKYPIVASMVVAEKKAGSGGAGNMVDTVLNIIGLRDLKSVSLHSTLAELGMDSMMAVEIKQTLEREYEVFLTPQDIRAMTFAKLQEISSSKSSQPEEKQGEESQGNEIATGGLRLMVRTIGEEKTATDCIVKMNDNVVTGHHNRLFLLPGIEGYSPVFKALCTNLDFETYCVQYDHTAKYDTIEAHAQCVYERMKDYIDKKHVVRIIGYSFGGIVSLELLKILEGLGYQTAITIIDGSPDVLKQVVKNSLNVLSDDEFQIGVVLGFVDILYPQDKTKMLEPLATAKDWEARIDIVLKATQNNLDFTEKYKKDFMTCIYKRLRAITNYEGVSNNLLKAPLTLIKPGTNIVLESDDDYGLSKYFTGPARVYVVEGNHLTLLDNVKTATIIKTVMTKTN